MGPAQEELTVVVQAKDEASAKIKAVQKQIKSAGADFEKVGKKMQTVGESMTRNLTLPIVGVGIAAVKSFSDFETRLANISTLISGDSTQAIKGLETGILNMVKVIPKSADELGASAYDIVSAGISDTAEVLKVLGASAKLAVAGLGTTEEATNLMTSALNAFKQEGLSADETADILFKTVKAGKTTVAQLARSFGAVAPTASAVGVSLRELQASTAALTTTGLPASVAQAQLRQSMVALIKPTAEMQVLFDKLGIKSGEASIKQDGLVGTMNKLKGAAQGNTEQMAKAFGSVEALNAVMALTGPVGESFRSTMASMEDPANAMTEAFNKQSKTTAAQFQLLKNKMNVELIKLGRTILPMVIKIVEGLSQKLESLSNWWERQSDGTKKLVVQLATFVAVAGPTLLVVGKMVTAVGAVVKVMSLLGGAGGAVSGATAGVAKFGGVMRLAPLLMNPWVLGIGAGALALGFLGKKIYDATRETKSMNDTVQKAPFTLTPYSDAINTVSVNTQTAALSTEKLNEAISFSKIFTDAQTNAEKDLALAKEKNKTLDEQQPAIMARNNEANQRVVDLQKEKNRVLSEYGTNSPQYRLATQNLTNAELELINSYQESLGWTLNVTGARGSLQGATERVTEATKNLDNWQRILNGGLDSGVQSIANFGPTADAQIRSIANLQVNLQKVADLSGDLGQIEQQAIRTNDLLNGATKKARDLDFNSGNIFQTGGSGLNLSGGAPSKQRALGGPVSRGDDVIVGERREERFVPRTSGRIDSAPADKSSKSEVHAHVHVGVFAGTKQELRALSVSLAKVLQQEMKAQNVNTVEMLRA